MDLPTECDGFVYGDNMGGNCFLYWHIMSLRIFIEIWGGLICAFVLLGGFFCCCCFCCLFIWIEKITNRVFILGLERETVNIFHSICFFSIFTWPWKEILTDNVSLSYSYDSYLKNCQSVIENIANTFP